MKEKERADKEIFRLREERKRLEEDGLRRIQG